MITKKEACRIATSEHNCPCIEELRETNEGFIIYLADEHGVSLEQFPIFVKKIDGFTEPFNVMERTDELRKSRKVYIPALYLCARPIEISEEDKRRQWLAYHGTPEEIEAEVKKILKAQRRRK